MLDNFHSSYVKVVSLILLFNFSLAQNSFTNDYSVMRDPSGYKLRSGDKVRVTVVGESDCSGEFTINREGNIRLNYIGEIKVNGLNTKAIEAVIAKRYQSELIFRKPTVSVFVVTYTERVVYLSGSLNRQGPYVFPPEVEAMNIVEVIARAGGFSDIARKNKVYVTRTFHDNNGKAVKTETYTVDVEALSKGLVKFGTSKRFWIYPGDRIQVPERLI